MRSGINFIKHLLFLPVVIWIVSSCTTDRDFEPYDKHTEIIFNVRIPVGSQPSTRALDTPDEYKVTETDVLVFNHSTQKFLYLSFGMNNLSQPDNNTVSFSAKLYKVQGVGSYDFLIVANARHILNEHYPTGIPTDGSVTKTIIQDKLTAAITAGTGWIADKGNSSYKHMPMWGELADQVIETKRYPATFTRMTAKIDVTVELEGASANDTFVMEEAWLYNYNTRGYLIPNPANWGVPGAEDVPAGDDLHERALRPSVKTGWLDTSAGIDYSSGIGDEGKSLVNSIYTFEAATQADSKNNLCVVIKGAWTRGGVTQTGWYRMDFANTDANFNTTFLTIRRNHWYKMKITLVSGKGYDSKEKALGSIPANITGTVVPWDEGGLGNTTTDGQYTLSVSRLEYSLTREARTAADTDNRLRITTDYVNSVVPASSGWSATVWEDQAGAVPVSNDATTRRPWLSLSQSSGNGNYPTGNEICFNVADNGSGGTRTAWIHIKAGRMLTLVKVEQLTTINISVFLRDQVTGYEVDTYTWFEDVINHFMPEEFNFNLTWSPRTAPVNIINRNLQGGTTNTFPFNNTCDVIEPDQIIPAGGGPVRFTVRPKQMTNEEIEAEPFYERNSLILFTVYHDGDFKTKTLLLRYVYPNLLTEGFKEGLHTQTITAKIKANVPWAVTVSDPDNILESYTGQGNGDVNGEDFVYTFKENVVGAATFTFSSADPQIAITPVSVTVNCVEFFARSNIVMKSDGTLTFATDKESNAVIPANSQGLYFKFGSLIGISPEGEGEEFTPSKTPLTSSHVVFVPTDYPAPMTWTWNDIPNENRTPRNSRIEDWFIDIYPVRGYDIATGRGDICRYISDQGWVSGRWRVPTGEEYRILENETTIETTVTAGNGAQKGSPIGTFSRITNITDNNGMFRIESGWFTGPGLTAGMNTTENMSTPPTNVLFFPAGGSRREGGIRIPGEYGYVWTSTGIFSTTPGVSKNAMTNYYNRYTFRYNVFGGECISYANGNPIRCVRDL